MKFITTGPPFQYAASVDTQILLRGTNICERICGIFVEQISVEKYVEYLWIKYFWNIMWNILGTNICRRICGIFVEQISMEDYVEFLWNKYLWKMC